MIRVGALALAITLGTSVGCAQVKPVVRSAVDIARDLCALVVSERRGISAADAARMFCATEKQLEPWLNELLEAERRAAARTEGANR